MMAEEIVDFKKQVLEARKPVLVDFWATWCGPCRMLAPTFEEAGDEMKSKVKFMKLQLDHPDRESENQRIASDYGIRGIPTMILFKDGEAKDSISGVMDKDRLKAKVEAMLK